MVNEVDKDDLWWIVYWKQSKKGNVRSLRSFVFFSFLCALDVSPLLNNIYAWIFQFWALQVISTHIWVKKFIRIQQKKKCQNLSSAAPAALHNRSPLEKNIIGACGCLPDKAWMKNCAWASMKRDSDIKGNSKLLSLKLIGKVCVLVCSLIMWIILSS